MAVDEGIRAAKGSRGAKRMASTAAVEIVVDPTLVTATREWSKDTFLEKSENLGDLPDPAAARENLGLGAAFEADLDTTFMAKAANLSDVADPKAARANLGLGDAEIYFTGSGF